MLEIIIDIHVLFDHYITRMKPRLTRGKGEIQGSSFEIMKNLDKIIQIFVYRVSLRVDFDNFVMVTFIFQVGILISLQTMLFPIVPSFNGASLIRWR